MSDLIITHFDSAYIQVKCDRALSKELSQYFTFFVPNYQYTPAYKNKIWDGQIRLFNVHSGKLYAGLTDYLLQFAKDRNYTVEYEIPEIEKVSPEQVFSFIKNLKISIGDKEIMPHEHQFDAIHHAINKRRCLLLSPTGSGKSLIIYVLIRYYLSKLPEDKKVLVIVPTTGLVTQMMSDFEDYSGLSKWNAKRNCHTVYSGQAKKSTKRVTISTWQSIYKLPQSEFEDVGAVIGDECHLFKAKSLTGLLTKLTDAEYRVGTTGTLDGTLTHKLVIEGLFGKVKRVVTTKDLMEKNLLSNINIQCVTLDHADKTKREAKKLKYQEEMDFLVNHTPRNKFICDLVSNLKGNTLVLFNYVEKHGKPLYNMIDATKGDEYETHLIYGGTDVSQREDIRKLMEKKTNTILVASYGTCSTGINIRNINNIVFASPSKSVVRVLQSIGRGLRKAENKNNLKVFDISDDLRIKSSVNHTYNHMLARLKIYKNENFNYKVLKVKLEGVKDGSELI
jgi:superfamily II DNA or RNA helicase